MVQKTEDKTAIIFSVALILHVVSSVEDVVYNPIMFEIATKRSPIDIKAIILREFVLRSGHITNVVMIISAPSIDSEPAVVEAIILREFVLRSGHITNVVMIISAPSIDSEPAVVDKTLFTTPVAIAV